MKTFKWIRRIDALAVCFLVLSGTVVAQNGRIERGRITSEALAANLLGDSATRNYQVYLPPSYDLTKKHYPVIYVLHGYFGNETEQVNTVRSSLNTLIRQRRIGEMIAVFVNGANRLNGSFYGSSPVIGDYETYITQDLVRLMDDRYRTLSSRESRGITGNSMGGWGAMHLAFKFPDTFSVAVPESGMYDSFGAYFDGSSRLLASQNVTNLARFDGLSFPVNAIVALFAGLTPNLGRPRLYTDYPYERVSGEVLRIDSVYRRALEKDVQNGDLAHYLQQPVRLHGIKVVHGLADPVVPIREARQFTNALAAAGVEFEYEEHTGGHGYRPELALPFLSAHLQGAELYIAPPRLTLGLASGGPQVEFSTQTNVVYVVESAAALDVPHASWIERNRVTGDGQTATFKFAHEGEARFFRISAANLP